MTKNQSTIQKKIGVSGLFFSLIFGTMVRLSAPYTAGFPINDGGLFHVMITALVNNKFILPYYVEFSGLSIPFTYPPLGFYVGGFLSEGFRVDPINILQWLPSIILIFTIPAFFWLANTILKSVLVASLATFAYTFTPVATQWAMMGGGLTRSFGLLFLLLTVASTYQLFAVQKTKYAAYSILFGSLTVLSHPEATLNAVSFCLLLWLFFGRNRAGIINAVVVALGILAITAIWWVPILIRFGLDPYLAAGQSNPHLIIALLFPFVFTPTHEPQLTIIAVLGLFGFAYVFSQKKYFLAIFFLMPYFVQLRSAPVYASIGLAMLAGLVTVEILLPAISSQRLENNVLSLIVLAYLAIYLPGNAILFNQQFTGMTVSNANRTAFAWVKSNTLEGGKFLLLTGETNGYCDGISEWFPALTGRINPVVVQGTEWLPGKLIYAIQANTELQSCFSSNNIFGCIKTVTKNREIDYNYLYIVRKSKLKQGCGPTKTIGGGESLIATLENLTEYSLVYKTDDVAIFTRKPELP